jgi:hypothetical protein
MGGKPVTWTPADRRKKDNKDRPPRPPVTPKKGSKP